MQIHISVANLLALLLSACAGSGVLSPSQLNSDPSFFHGKQVTVRGYVVIAPEGHNLRDSKQIFDEFATHYDVNTKPDPAFNPRAYAKFCLTIANPDFIYEHMAAFEGKTLVFRGRFVSDYLHDNEIDAGACLLPTAIIIDTEDLKARYGQELKTVTVPPVMPP